MIYLLSAIVLLLVFINLVVNVPAVQTWLCQKVAGYYSKRWHTRVTVGKVDFELLKKLVLRNVYVQDQHADTLLYADALKFDISSIDFDKHILHMSNIELDQTKLRLTTYKNTHELNLQFIIDAVASKDTSKSPGAKWDISSDGIVLNGVDFRLLNQNDTETVQGMNYANLRVHNIYANFSDIQFDADTLRATIDNMRANEACGFELKKMSCFVKLSSHGMELDALQILTPQTNLYTDLVFKFKRFQDFNDFVTNVNMKAVFKKSTICFQDVGYFAPGLRAVHNCFELSGKYTGTVSHLHGEDMDIGWGKFSRFKGEADMNGLPDIDKTVIKVHVASLVTSKNEIEALPKPPFDVPQNLSLPDNVGLLNNIRFSGNFNGYISDFTADGVLTTDIGNIIAALHMREDTASKLTSYRGTMQTQAFNVGRFLNIKDMGSVTALVTIEGSGMAKNNADARIAGSIQSFYFKQYNYKNTTLNGEFKRGFFSGTAKVNDPNLHMDFDGDIDFASAKHQYKFDSRIYKADLMAMHIVKDTTSSALLSSHVKVDLVGNTANDITGTIDIDSTFYVVHRQAYHMNYLKLVTDLKDGNRTMNMTSDYADVNVNGHYTPLNSLQCFQGLIAYYIPDRFSKEQRPKNNKDFHDYAFDIKFKENTGLTDLFIPGLKIAQGSDVKGYYKEKAEDFSLACKAPYVEFSGRRARNLTLSANGNSRNLLIKANADTLNMSDSIYAVGFNLNANTNNDTIHYNIGWNNDTSNHATIPGYIAFSKGTQVDFKMINPVVELSDSAWKLNKDNLITIDTSGTTAKDFMFYHGNQYISIMGKLSNRKTDALLIDFHKFNLENLLVTASTFKGTVDGSASVSFSKNHILFVSALTFNNLYFNGEHVGDGNVNSYWDNSTQSIATNGQILLNDNRSLSFLGNYYPSKDSENVSIDATLHGFLMKTFTNYTKGYCSDMDGALTGNIHMSGNLNKPVFHGTVVANINRIKVDYLNTYYHTPELEIAIAPDTFQIKPSRLFDDKGDTAIVSGNLLHNHFKNFKLDFAVTTNNFYCLNKADDNNSSYFGQGYVSGQVNIYGYLSSIHIDANITTQKRTVFNIPLSNASEVEETDFIHLVNRKDPKKQKKQAYKVNLTGLQMDFMVHATPDATAKVIFASKVGDILTGRGNGNIEITMNNLGDINMQGNYTVTDGSYRFVLQNVINEDFNLEPGGTIEWNGNPYNADININTKHLVRTSLEPLFPFDTTHTYTKVVPVNVGLDLSGKLTSPDIKFDIDLPTVDQETRQTVASYLANPDEMNRQVFALLIIKSFLPVQEGASNAAAPTPTIIPGTAATAILSSQLTNLLNSISNKVNVGVNINPATTLSPQEVQLLLSTELLGGRVLINTDMSQIGTTSSGAQTENTNNVVGEVTVEYLVSKDGKLRFKAFNKANDNTIVNIQNAPYTQGAGLSYRETFNSWGELINKIRERIKNSGNKKDTTTTTPPKNP